MKILLLGGTGAMGVPLSYILCNRGHEVYVTTRKSHTSDKSNLVYVVGNAHDERFIKETLAIGFDTVVDFMVYGSDEFKKRSQLLLSSCGHYFFLSSSRVYANSPDSPIKESSPRLLDVTTDREYLKSDEYALAKAREENILFSSTRENWTIIRPYITYNDNRLQLGVFEKEAWLQRALNGKAIVFYDDVASKYTTLTYGYDVALRMADLVERNATLGEAIHITAGDPVLWKDVLEIYLDVFEQKLGKRPKVVMLKDSRVITKMLGGKWQVNCDRLYNRRFDNSRVVELTGNPAFTSLRSGLASCLASFLDHGSFLARDWYREGIFDRFSHEKTMLSEIEGASQKLLYFIGRWFPVNPNFAYRALVKLRSRQRLKQASASSGK